jgi:hypothetical protein
VATESGGAGWEVNSVPDSGGASSVEGLDPPKSTAAEISCLWWLLPMRTVVARLESAGKHRRQRRWMERRCAAAMPGGGGGGGGDSYAPPVGALFAPPASGVIWATVHQRAPSFFSIRSGFLGFFLFIF